MHRSNLAADAGGISDSSFKFGEPSSPGRKSFTPKAFHIVAQGCREAAHPGFEGSENLNPERVAQSACDQKLLKNTMFQLVEPFQGSLISSTITQGGAASPLTLGYDV